jgi:hypothetical protein
MIDCSFQVIFRILEGHFTLFFLLID